MVLPLLACAIWSMMANFVGPTKITKQNKKMQVTGKKIYRMKNLITATLSQQV